MAQLGTGALVAPETAVEVKLTDEDLTRLAELPEASGQRYDEDGLRALNA